MYLNIGFIVSGFFGRFLGGRGSCFITIVCVSLLFFKLSSFLWGRTSREFYLFIFDDLVRI